MFDKLMPLEVIVFKIGTVFKHMVRKLDYPIKHMVQGEQIWDIKQGSEAV
jgi:hypothetical protein